MSHDQWTDVDRYYEKQFHVQDAALDAALKASADGKLPAIQVSATQGRWLQLMAKAMGARRILEIGTLGGYSTIWLARALPAGGQLVTLEVDPHHADVARQNFTRAGVADKIDLRVGSAAETLPALVRDRVAPFDFIFIDADKPGYAGYFRWSLQLSRPGTLIVADNVVRDGEIVDAKSRDVNVQAIRTFNDVVAAERRVTATALQTVGVKGYDGFALMLVN